MSERIRQLEDALAIFQAGISSERHPLLRDELLTIKFGPEVRRTIDDEFTRNAMSQSIDALGTLTIGDNGETKYIGRSGGSEVRLRTHTIGYPVTKQISDSIPGKLALRTPVFAGLCLLTGTGMPWRRAGHCACP